MLKFARLVAALALLVTLWPAAVVAQTRAGVVTNLEGSATAARSTVPQPVALKFKDDVFQNDRVVTGDRSVVRMLLGGKAVVTVRERSSLTITEIPGKTTVDLDVGKIAVAVARERMKPGEQIEVKTPNAVAAVRGTVFIIEVIRATAQAGPGGPGGVTTNVFGFGGLVNVLFGGGPANVGPGNFASGTGNLPPIFGNMTPGQAQGAIGGLHVGGQNLQGGGNSAKDTAYGVTNVTLGPGAATQLGSGAAGGGTTTTTTTTTQTTVVQPQILPGGSTTLGTTNVTNLTSSGNNLLTNGGFETGDLTGWTLTGTGGIISSLGSIVPPEGKFMAIITTAGTGPFSEVLPKNTLTSGGLSSGAIFLVKATYSFFSNEYPTQSTFFNDTFNIKVVDGLGVVTTLATETRNSSFTSSTVSSETATVTGLHGPSSSFTISAGNGVTGFKNLSKTVVSTGAGLQGLVFEIFNVGDDVVDSAALIDAVVVTEDPPLYFLGNGAKLVRTTTDPLLSLNGATQTFDSLMVVCCQGSVSLAGPLLKATNSNLTVPFSLLSVVQGGSVTTTSAEPLVSLSGGSYTLGSQVSIFDLAGVNTATDAATGLVLGTDKPLQHGGVFFEASGATVNTQTVFKIDTALLEATAPLLNLTSGALLTTGSHAIDLVNQAKISIPNDAIAMINLNGASLTVTNGNLVNVAGGSLSLAGSLLSLSGGSTVNILNGLLLNVTGGSNVSIGGSLVSFSGTGNLLNVNNSFVPTAVIGGVPVYGPVDNFRISGSALAGLNSAGTIKINGVALTPTNAGQLKGSLVAIQGGGTVKIGK